MNFNAGDYHLHMTREQWQRAISVETLAEHGNADEMERMVLPTYRDHRMQWWANRHSFSISTTVLDWSSDGEADADTSPRFSILWAGTFATPWDAPSAHCVGYFYGQASELNLFVNFLNRLTCTTEL